MTYRKQEQVKVGKRNEKKGWKPGHDSIALSLISFSIPLILSGILQQLYNWVDAFVVGNVDGELALAAVGSTGSIINFYLLALTGFTLGVILTPQMLRLMNTTPDTFELAADYLRIIFLGVPFLAIYNVYSAALRGLGDSRAPFLSILLSSAVNVILDIWLVAVLDWNVSGAAIATVVSQIAMTVFLVIYAVLKYPLLRFGFGKNLIRKTALREGVRLGFPPMIQSSVNAFGNLILQNFMNGFGSQTVAAITTAYRVDTIVILPMTNLGSGISTLVAQSCGAGDEKRARKTFLVGTGMMVVVSLLLTCMVIPMGGPLISLFGASAQVVEIGRNFFRGLAVFYVVLGLSTAARSFLEGTGDVLYSSFAGILSLIVRIIASYAFAHVFGNMIIAYAEAFAWGVMLLLYLARLAVKWKIPHTGFSE